MVTAAPAGCTARSAGNPASSPSPGDCQIRYVVRPQPTGFTADVTVTNTGTGLKSWAVAYDFPAADQRVSQGWNATWSQAGTRVTATGHAPLGEGASVTAGFNATGDPGAVPTGFTLNGVGCTSSADRQTEAASRPGPATAPTLRVAGNRLVDADGNPVPLVGVNRSGGEFMCVHGGGFWDGPVDDGAIASIATWHVRAVRIPLNADCWLATNQSPAPYSGASYRQAVTSLVTTLEARGIVPILDLHWTAGTWTGRESQCTDTRATCQKPVPDAEHSPAFWASVADTFRADATPIFDLFNEPYPADLGIMSRQQSWQCWLHGNSACPGLSYRAAGMQDLVDAVRRTGSSNVVLAGGNSWAGDLTGWLAHRPTDPTGNLGASWHSYDRNSCNQAECWDRQIAPVAAQVPVVATEIGEHDCTGAYVSNLMPWLDAHTAGYLAWTWNTWDCRSGPALITNYDGTATPYGAAVRDHLLSR
nr:cellulase family glycosylhydrolase [Planosporangium mesophilum]